MKNCTLTYEEFYTGLVEIGGVWNSRPLTYIDRNDIEEPLTPMHLYCGHRILNRIEGEDYESDPDFKKNRALSSTFKKAPIRASTPIFLEAWKKRLFIELRSTHVGNKTKENNIKVNDKVTVLGEYQKRDKWQLGKIEKIIAGRDGIIRGAEVKVTEQNKKRTVLIRPLQKLFPLEMNENEIRSSSNPRMKKTDAISTQI